MTPDNQKPSQAEALNPSEEKAAWGIVDPNIDPVVWFKDHLAHGRGNIHCVWLPNHQKSVGGHSVLLAIVGNGPRSEANAKAIVEVWNDNRSSDAQIAALKEQKDWAYSERNKLVSALSKLFPSHLEDHPASDTTWENDWRNIVFINLPTGQCSWHIHDSELPMFAHLSRLCGNSWDGHTNGQKYERLAALAANPESEEGR